jgi:hypothetical protein
MRMLIIGCSFVGVVVALLLLARRPAAPSPTPTHAQESHSPVAHKQREPSAGVPQPAVDIQAPLAQPQPQSPRVSEPTSPASRPRPVPPASLAGFWTWPPDRRDKAVTILQRDDNWPTEVRTFMTQSMQDKSLPLVTRNNIAAGLMHQTPPVLEFEPLLLRMSDDTTEDPEWRNYTVQFLAEVLPTAADRPRVEQALRTVAAAEVDPRAATAVLHLARLGAAGTIALDAGFDAQVLALVQNARQPDYARATALAVAGARRIAGAQELARTLAEPGHASDLRRAAIGVLGSSTESMDQAKLRAYTQDADPAVRLVAEANVKKL